MPDAVQSNQTHLISLEHSHWMWAIQFVASLTLQHAAIYHIDATYIYTQPSHFRLHLQQNGE